MVYAESLTYNKINKLSFLSRQRITRYFWHSKSRDEIIFVSAPMLYGKTVAVIEAMETLHNKYLYIRFDSCMNNPSCFCSYLINRLCNFSTDSYSDSVRGNSKRGLMTALGNTKELNAIIFDDFQCCTGQAVINIVKSIYTMYGNGLQLILISRCGLPEEFYGWQYKSKIISLTEDSLAFSDTEIKKLAELNKLLISTADTRRIHEQSAGCIGFIEEYLKSKEYFSILGNLPDHTYSCIEKAVVKLLSAQALGFLSELCDMNEIPVHIAEEFNDGKKVIKEIRIFIYETGLVKEEDNSFILHRLFKKYLKEISVKKINSKYKIFNTLISKNAFTEALQYSVSTQNLDNIETSLSNCLACGLKISDSVLEKIYGIFKENPTPNDMINFFLRLFEMKAGGEINVDFIPPLIKKYSGVEKNLKAHVFTSPYPHVNAEHGFITVNVSKSLIECGKLYENMDFTAALELIRTESDSCTGAEKAAFFMLLINVLRGLYMYNSAKKEFDAFENWAVYNREYEKTYKDYYYKIMIADGDMAAAEEWLAVNCVSVTAKIYRNNIEKIIIDAFALIAAGESDAAIYRLKNTLLFSEKACMRDIQIESLSLLALAYQKKRQTETAVIYMEKAVSIADKYKKPAVIGQFGNSLSFLIEKCYSRANKKNTVNNTIHKLLLYVKNKNTHGGVLQNKKCEVPLSNRQLQILNLLNENYTYNSIAEDIGVKITTVRDHIKKLYEKLEVRNASDALVKAKEKNLI